MNAPAQDPVDRLRAFIQSSGIDAELIKSPADAATVPAAAAALGVHVTQIVKSLLFESRRGESVLVVASGTERVDRHRVAEVTGLGHLKLASPDHVLAVTGYAVGGMPPIGHESRLAVIVDEVVLQEPIVYGGGGQSDYLLRIRPDDIVRLTSATVANVARSEP